MSVVSLLRNFPDITFLTMLKTWELGGMIGWVGGYFLHVFSIGHEILHWEALNFAPFHCFLKEIVQVHFPVRFLYFEVTEKIFFHSIRKIFLINCTLNHCISQIC